MPEARLVPHTELTHISSSWARRLGSGATETVLHLRAVAVDVPGGRELADPVDPGAAVRADQAADEAAESAGS